MEIKFKIADMSYYQQVVDLCGTWWEDSHFYKQFGMPYKPEKEIFQALEEIGLLFPVVGTVKDEVVACFIGTIGPYHFNTDYIVCSEIVWCVKPEMQKHGASVELIKFVETALKEKGVNLINLNVPATRKFNGVGAYLEESHGFSLIDKSYFKEL